MNTTYMTLHTYEWPEKKLPLLDCDATITQPNVVTKVQNNFDPEALKSENFEISVLTTLTPPQSPPQAARSAAILQNAIATEGAVNFNNYFQQSPVALSPVPTSVTPSTAHAVVSSVGNLHFTPLYNATPFTPSEAAQTDDDKRNSQIVDDILKSFIKELPDLNYDCESNSSSSYSTETRPESIVTDEEWSPDSSFSSSAGSSPTYNGADDDDNSSQFVLKKSTGPKKRTRPYGRGVEDRKIRKKEQNKNAATRYRQKKKVEMENILNEEQKLAQRNEELKNILAERQREAKYLKTLIKEFYGKKGCSKKTSL